MAVCPCVNSGHRQDPAQPREEALKSFRPTHFPCLSQRQPRAGRLLEGTLISTHTYSSTQTQRLCNTHLPQALPGKNQEFPSQPALSIPHLRLGLARGTQGREDHCPAAEEKTLMDPPAYCCSRGFPIIIRISKQHSSQEPCI